MKIDLTQILKDHEDKPINAYKVYLLADKDTKQPLKEGENFIQYGFEDKSEELLLGKFIRECLLTDWEGITSSDKLDKFTLLVELNKKEKFDFSARHIELIKKSIETRPTWVYGLIHSLLK